MGDFQAVFNGFRERLDAAHHVAVEHRWEDCIELYTGILADIKSCKAKNQKKEDLDEKAELLKSIEKIIKDAKQNIKIENELLEIITRQNGSPEPPADPDVWSKPAPLPSRVNSKKNSATTAPGKASKPGKGGGAAPAASNISTTSGYGQVDKNDKPVNPSQSILPPNAAGEVFDASLYDTSIVQAVRACLQLTSEYNHTLMNEVVGMTDVKTILHEAVTLPLIAPAFFKGIRSPWKGLCLAGPPGTGKTLIARAIGCESNSSFFSVSSSDFTSKWRGDSEKIVRLLFEVARFYAPSIIFVDEIDSIGGQRGLSGEHEASRRLKTEFLVQMDGIKNKADERQVFVIAATNHPWELDEALRRRLEKRIFVPLPELESRKVLILNSMKDMVVADDLNYDELARRTEGYSGADVISMCKSAAYNVLRRFDTLNLSAGGITQKLEYLKDEPIKMMDFEFALRSVSASVTPESVKKCQEWCESYGST